MPDFCCPVSRLQLAQQEIDKTFGVGFARVASRLLVAFLNRGELDRLGSFADGVAIERAPERCWGGEAVPPTVPAACGRTGGAVCSILTVLSALGVVVFGAMLIIALMEGLDAY